MREAPNPDLSLTKKRKKVRNNGRAENLAGISSKPVPPPGLLDLHRFATLPGKSLAILSNFCQPLYSFWKRASSLLLARGLEKGDVPGVAVDGHNGSRAYHFHKNQPSASIDKSIRYVYIFSRFLLTSV